MESDDSDVVSDVYAFKRDDASEVVGDDDDALSEPGEEEASEVVRGEEEAAAAGLAKNRASCTSVGSSSPGRGASSLGDRLAFRTRLRTVRWSFLAPGEEDWVGILVGAGGGFGE